MNETLTLKNAPSSQPWYKERWPWILMAGPAAVIVAGVITVWYAIDSNDGLVEDDYYKQGLAVNQQLQRDKAAGEMGLSAELMLGGEGRLVRISLFNQNNQVLPDKLTLRVVHPTRAGADQTVQLVAEGPGFFSGKLTQSIEHGRWRVSLEDGAGQWRLSGLWKTDKSNSLKLVPAKQ